MKRFFTKAASQPCEGGYSVTLDGRALRTPAKAPLIVPTAALGAAIAAEWNAQEAKIDPRNMPMTGLANAAIDRIAPNIESFADGITVFGESDLVAYRAEQPASLIARQAALWDPVIDWARSRFDIAFLVTSGIIHQPQPETALQRLRTAVRTRSPFELAGLQALVTISGSLLIGLALHEQAINLDTAWEAGHVDELWQAEQWGEDELALQARAARRRDFETAARFLDLLR